MSPKTKSQATLRCGVAADEELLRPEMLVPSQNSWNNNKFRMEEEKKKCLSPPRTPGIKKLRMESEKN